MYDFWLLLDGVILFACRSCIDFNHVFIGGGVVVSYWFTCACLFVLVCLLLRHLRLEILKEDTNKQMKRLLRRRRRRRKKKEEKKETNRNIKPKKFMIEHQQPYKRGKKKVMYKKKQKHIDCERYLTSFHGFCLLIVYHIQIIGAHD